VGARPPMAAVSRPMELARASASAIVDGNGGVWPVNREAAGGEVRGGTVGRRGGCRRWGYEAKKRRDGWRTEGGAARRVRQRSGPQR
jgi:hypothetical protein